MENTLTPAQENHYHNDNRIQILNITQQPERVVYKSSEDYDKLLECYNGLQDILVKEKEYSSKLSGMLKEYVDEVLKYKAENKELKEMLCRQRKPRKALNQ